MSRNYSLFNVVTFIILVIFFDCLIAYGNLRDKFHNVTIEVGTESIDLKTFVVSNVYLKRGKSLTDLENIDLSETGEYDIKLVFGDEEENVKLNIVDTTPPEVEFQDLEVGLDYQFNKDDFVLLVRDLSDYEITSDMKDTYLQLRKYKVNIKVTDIYGNETSKECILNVKLNYEEVIHELGTPLNKDEILLSNGFGNKELTDEILNTVNVNKIGEYEIEFNYKDEKYKTKVIVKDTKGPNIVVNNINFYLGSKAKKNEDFIKKITDPSGIKEIKYEGKLDFKKLGVQELKIIAIDNLGNISEKIATLTVKNDNVGPKITGLTTIKIKKGEKIDYLNGVKAVDAKDGKCEVSVDTSKVNTKKYGTYYAIYTSKDKSNNITTKKRKIVIEHDDADVEALFNDYYDKHLAGKSIMQMTKYIRTHISYSHDRGEDPLFMALTEKKGTCYGHAVMLKKALDKAGVPNCMIYTNGKAHYWNYVYENGAWRHYDSNPGTHVIYVATDKQKLATKAIHGRSINKSLCPPEAR